MSEIEIEFNEQPTMQTLDHLAANGWALYQWRGNVSAVFREYDAEHDYESFQDWVEAEIGPDCEREDYSYKNPYPEPDTHWAGGDGDDD